MKGKTHFGDIFGEVLGLFIAWWMIVNVVNWNLPFVVNEKWLAYVDIGLAVAVADFILGVMAILFGAGLMSGLMMVVKDGVTLVGTWYFLQIYPFQLNQWLSLNMDIDAGVKIAMIISMVIIVVTMVIRLGKLIFTDIARRCEV